MRKLLISFLFTLPLFAQHPTYVRPGLGSTLGGDVVTIGSLAIPSQEISAVRFGSSQGVAMTRVDAATVRVTTPPSSNYAQGPVVVEVLASGQWIDTGARFWYEERPPNDFERLLLPVFAPTAHGHHGSQFVSELEIANTSDEVVEMFGLTRDCVILCPDIYLRMYGLTAHEQDKPLPSGNPGAFIFVRPEDRVSLPMQLRVFDTSRSAANFGTTIPIVRADEMRTTPTVLLGVPTDSRFRNTLRIYAENNPEFDIVIENADETFHETHRIQLREPMSVFDPAYAEFAAFPSEVGPVRVTISYVHPVLVDPPPEPEPFWAFISVTNNETQHITVISPQR